VVQGEQCDIRRGRQIRRERKFDSTVSLFNKCLVYVLVHLLVPYGMAGSSVERNLVSVQMTSTLRLQGLQ
jgi:hypothetical protein